MKNTASRSLARKVAQKSLQAKRPRTFEKKTDPIAERIYSAKIKTLLRKEFTPEALQVFDFYPLLREVVYGDRQLGMALDAFFTQAVRKFITSKGKADGQKPSYMVINQMMQAVAKLRPHLKDLSKLVSGEDAADLERAVSSLAKILDYRKSYSLVNILASAARDKGIYLKQVNVGQGKGLVRWFGFQKMRPKEEELAYLEDTSPEAFEAMTKYYEATKALNDAIEDNVVQGGMTYSKEMVFAKRFEGKTDEIGNPVASVYRLGMVHIGTDPETGEKLVYDPFNPDMAGVPLELYEDSKIQEQKEKKKLRNANTPRKRIASYSDQWMRDKIKKMRNPDWGSEELSEVLAEQNIEYLAITDDRGKKDRKNKVLPTKFIPANVKDRFMVEVGGDAEYKDVRNALKKLARDSDSIEWESITKMVKGESKKTRGIRVFFDAEDRSKVRALIKKVGLTEGKPRQTPFTKILPTKQIEGERIVVSGRYEGVMLDDLINNQGRMLEGNSWAYDEKLGRHIKIDPTEREPFVTVSDYKIKRRGKVITKKKLFMIVPGGNSYTLARRKVGWPKTTDKKKKKSHEDRTAATMKVKDSERLIAKVPTIISKKTKNSKAIKVWFDPKDYTLIKRAVGSMTLSAEALRLIRGHFENQAQAELAIADENLGFYSSEALGGFKKSIRWKGQDRPFEFLNVQKKAMAWLDANEDRGVCALDTGIGKTLTALGMIQKFNRDGLLNNPQYNVGRSKVGRILYVAPAALVGNLGDEAAKFMTEEVGMNVKGRIDGISYEQFKKWSKTRQIPNPETLKKSQAKFANPPMYREWGDSEWTPEKYIAVFFDEGHKYFTKLTSRDTKAALLLDNPRKIVLTASPMQQEPMEAYTLWAITNNKHELALKGAAGSQARKERNMWKRRFCQTVGGRIVGPKDDPETLYDLNVWTKRNIFFADKLDVQEPESKVPTLNPDPSQVHMPQEIETVYRAVSKVLGKELDILTRKFRALPKDWKSLEKVRSEEHRRAEMLTNDGSRIMGGFVKVLNGLSNYPADMFRWLADLMEGKRPMLNGKPFKKFRKSDLETLAPFLAEFSKVMSPAQLREAASTMKNPKINMAVDKIMDRRLNSEDRSRSLLFSDDKHMIMLTAQRLSFEIPGFHAACLEDSIHVFRNGKEMTGEGSFPMIIPNKVIDEVFPVPQAEMEDLSVPDRRMARLNRRRNELLKSNQVAPLDLPFRPTGGSFLLYPRLAKFIPSKATIGEEAWEGYWSRIPKGEGDKWRKLVLNKIVQDGGFATCTLFGKVYGEGQNLQSFDTVVHLDRNDWNSEAMKQRTARSWRQGQKQPVTEVHLDMVYSYNSEEGQSPEQDPTLDVLRALHQTLESDLFNKIIKDSMKTDITREHHELQERRATLMTVDRKTAELMLSPYMSSAKNMEN